MKECEPSSRNERSPASPILDGIRIVLVRPQGGINIGSVARAMGNFGLRQLVLVAPRADFQGSESHAMARSSHDILETVHTVDSLTEAIADCHRVYGTTARLGERRCATLSPRDASREILTSRPVAIVFGPEDTGLNANDLDLCHDLLTIPTHPERSSLNLAQAVALVGYEIWMTALESGEAATWVYREKPAMVERKRTATSGEVEAALGHLEKTLDAIGYFRQTVPEHPMREIRRFVTRANPTRYELSMIRGMCRKTLNTLRYGEKKS